MGHMIYYKAHVPLCEAHVPLCFENMLFLSEKLNYAVIVAKFLFTHFRGTFYQKNLRCEAQPQLVTACLGQFPPNPPRDWIHQLDLVACLVGWRSRGCGVLLTTQNPLSRYTKDP